MATQADLARAQAQLATAQASGMLSQLEMVPVPLGSWVVVSSPPLLSTTPNRSQPLSTALQVEARASAESAAGAEARAGTLRDRLAEAEEERTALARRLRELQGSQVCAREYLHRYEPSSLPNSL